MTEGEKIAQQFQYVAEKIIEAAIAEAVKGRSASNIMPGSKRKKRRYSDA